MAGCRGVGDVAEQRVARSPALDDDLDGARVDPNGGAVVVAGVGVDTVKV